MASGLTIRVSSNAKDIARRFDDKIARQAAAAALTSVAAGARRDIKAKIPSLFKNVVMRTESAVRYQPADPGKSIEEMSARVFINDDRNKGISPAQYLRAEVLGGTRHDKRSEVSLINAGNMLMGQQWVPGDGSGPGPITGGMIVQILSQTKSFGEQGYRANANARTTRRLRKMGVPVHRTRLMTYFVARDKRSHEPIGIYRLVGPGHVEEVLKFVNKRPQYQARFPFEQMVQESVRANWPKAVKRALQQALHDLR